MAALCKLDQLIDMMSIGTLLAYTIVAPCVLLLSTATIVTMWHHTLALAFCALFLHSVQNMQIGGPTKYQIEQINPCDMKTKGLFYYDNYRISRYNMTTLTYSGTIVLKTELSDDKKLSFYAAVWGNGGWKKNFINNTVSKPCTFIKNFAPAFMKQLFQKVDTNGCPVKPNEYHFEDLPLIIKSISIPIPNGRYKFEFVLLDGDEKLGCVEIIATIGPQ